MEELDVIVSDNIGIAYNCEIPGVDHQEPIKTASDFVASIDIISAAKKMLRLPKIKNEVLANHVLGIRCFIFIPVLRIGHKEYKAHDAFVFTRGIGTYLVGDDLRFSQYIESYDLSWAIPIYISNDSDKSFHGGTIGQPWLDPDFIISQVKKLAI